MRHFFSPIVRGLACLTLAVLFVIAILPATVTIPVTAQQNSTITPDVPSIPPGSAYRQTNFISDSPGLATILDPLLRNPWGIASGATSPLWVVNNATSTTQLIRGDVGGVPLTLNPGLQTVNIPGGSPTGIVANATTDFKITPPGGGTLAAANFIFASETGNITAWNGAQGTTATSVLSMIGHKWTGLAIGANAGGNRLYAADFANNHIDVFDGTFMATTVSGGFIDATIPAGFSVFNIQNLGGSLYVTYAKINMAGDDVVNGSGLGLVRKFDTDGVRDPMFAINNGVALNAPWGLAIAPASFGIFGGALLVGNFAPISNFPAPGSNGPIISISAYNPATGAFLGVLIDESAAPISIDELWALQFGNGGNGGDPNTLYFTAGPGDEQHGLFGSLKPTTATATALIQFPSENPFTEETAANEGQGHVDVTVARTGDTSGTSTVNFATFDESEVGRASQISDYEIALGKLTFNPGETSKTIRILIVDDKFVEGDEILNVILSNPTGAGLGFPNVTRVRIVNNDSAPGSNPIDATNFFVRQQYLDFLNREADTPGFTFWTNNIESCGADVQCREVRRIDTSAAFFLSIEFQKTGLLAYLSNKAAFGPSAFGSPAPVLYGQFEKEVQQLQKDLIFGTPAFDAQLEANKAAYFNDFVNRPEFVSAYGSLTNTQYVDTLLSNAGISPQKFVVNLTNSQEVPPAVPTGRPGSYGTATFTLDASVPVMSFNATINNIDVTGSQTGGTTADNLVAAHIHAGPTVAPGVNGSVVWGFFGTPFNDNNPNDSMNTPFAMGVGGTFSGKWDAPEGNNTTLAAQLTNIQNGRAYINFHTTQFGGGEIRGNFPSGLQTFRDSLLNGLNAATETRASVLRKIAESQQFSDLEFNRAFVTMEYFGYLRRDPDTPGFNFWLDKLNSFGGDFRKAEMVKAFLSSLEYRARFGP